MRTKNLNAPFGTCNKCGFTGRDWAFKYQGLCGRCYQEWKSEKAKERRSRKLPNSNIAISESIIVTRNVHNRLKWEAQEIIPLSKKYVLAEKWSLICLAFPILFLVLLHLLDIKIHALLVVSLSLASLVAYYFLSRISKVELDKRMADVNSSLNQLADDRQKKIAEMKRFYQSAEWRLLRIKIIQGKGNVCCDCKKTISDPNDITVDHILPRSKYAKHALDEGNMQILCRSCNSKKGSSVPLGDANVSHG